VFDMATVRQQKAVANVVENGGNVSKAMIKAGYSKKTAKNPQKLTESVAWAELMDAHIGDAKLAKVHREGLGATSPFQKIVGRDSKGAPEYELVSVPDYSTRHKYLESGYKLRGRYVKESEGTKILIVNITGVAAKKYGINASPGTSDS